MNDKAKKITVLISYATPICLCHPILFMPLSADHYGC